MILSLENSIHIYMRKLFDIREKNLVLQWRKKMDGAVDAQAQPTAGETSLV